MSYADGLNTPKHNSQTMIDQRLKTVGAGNVQSFPQSSSNLVAKSKKVKRRRTY